MLGAFFSAATGAPRPRLRLFANCIRTIFAPLSSSGQCAVSIKLLLQQDLTIVRTATRDDLSGPIRRRIDSSHELRQYPINGNTAFSDIVTRANGKDYFFCNDLNALGDNYVNSNRAWQDYYNAAIVFPLKWPDSDTDEDSNLIGFLCIDSKNGTFTEEICLPILSLISRIMYYHLELFIEDQEPEPDGA